MKKILNIAMGYVYVAATKSPLFVFVMDIVIISFILLTEKLLGTPDWLMILSLIILGICGAYWFIPTAANWGDRMEKIRKEKQL